MPPAIPDPDPSAPGPAPGARELVEIEVDFISLVSVPANGRALVLKHAAGQVVSEFRLKAGPGDLRRAYGIVYPVGDVDSQGDSAGAAAVMRAADRWMLLGRAECVDRQHSFAREQAYVAESWIVRAGDPLFPGETPGAWAVGIQIGDPGLWKQCVDGTLAGLSLAGFVEVKEGSTKGRESSNESGPLGFLHKWFAKTSKGDSDMTPEEVKALISESVPKVVETALKAAGVQVPAPPSPVTKADLDTAMAAVKSELKAGLGEAAKAAVEEAITAQFTLGRPEGDTAPAGGHSDTSGGLL